MRGEDEAQAGNLSENLCSTTCLFCAFKMPSYSHSRVEQRGAVIIRRRRIGIRCGHVVDWCVHGSYWSDSIRIQ